jgi:acyl carrier protein
MDRHDIVTAIDNALAAVLDGEVGSVTEETRLFEDTHLDSTAVLELLVHVEDSTGIEIDPENLDMDDFTSVGSLTSYLQAQRVSVTTSSNSRRG